MVCDELDPFLEHDLPQSMLTSVLKVDTASDACTACDQSPVAATLPQIVHIEGDSDWYQCTSNRTDLEAVWVSYMCDKKVAAQVKTHMCDRGGVYLIECVQRPQEVDLPDWLGPFTVCNTQIPASQVWIQTNSVECARVYQKCASYPNSRKVRRGLAVSLRDRGMGWGSIHESMEHAFPVSEESDREDFSEDDCTDQEETPSQPLVEEPSPGQMRLMQKVHENLGHPRKGDFVRTLRLGGCRKGLLNWVRQYYQCPACPSKVTPKPIRPATVPRCYRFNEQLGVDLVQLHANGLQAWYLNMVDRGTNFQILERVESKTSEEVFCAFVRSWSRHYGVPRRVVVDEGNEFKGSFLTGVSGLGALVTVAGVRAPWQNGRIERHGGLLKDQLALMCKTESPESLGELDALVHACTTSKNRYSNRSGFSPQQRVFGTLHRLPGALTSDDGSQASLVCSNPEREFYRAARIRQTAASALMRLESRTRLGAAKNASVRKNVSIPPGSWVYFWFAPINGHAFWKGPAVLVGEETQCFWLSYGSKLVKCPKEHVRLATEDEAEGAAILEGVLSELKEELSTRGQKRFIDLSQQRGPPEDEDLQRKRKADQEAEEGHERENKKERTDPTPPLDPDEIDPWCCSEDTCSDENSVHILANAKTPGQGEVRYRTLDPGTLPDRSCLTALASLSLNPFLPLVRSGYVAWRNQERFG
eukprot:6470363-Amphidinium_carterae.2